ncbi:hypothetical protein EIO60_02556|nr:hypothetical protein [Candidatus Pantoea persica]
MLAQIAARQPGPLEQCWHRAQPRNPLAVRPQAIATQASVWFDLPQLATAILMRASVPG